MTTTLALSMADCFNNRWMFGAGVYWSASMVDYNNDRATIHMSRTGTGSCPGGADETHSVRYPNYIYFNNNKIKVGITRTTRTTRNAIVVISLTEVEEEPEPEEPEPEDPGFGFGRGEITQTNVGPGLIFNVGDNIKCLLRVMNTGDQSKIHGAVGLGYHDKEGRVFFTGKYMIDNIEIPSGETFTWNPSIEVLHKDYAAREMTPRGPAMYFMSGHEENNKVIWDRSAYIPVELLLESGYVDPLDPEGVPDDWTKPIYEKPDPWGDFWDIVTPEPEPKPKEEFDVMPFIYIGLAGLVGYILIRSQ